MLGTQSYTPFGMVRSTTGSFNTKLGFIGRSQGSITGLTYIRARYYDGSVGIFTKVDPIRDGLNWYGYAGGNPVNYVDNNGMEYIMVHGRKVLKGLDENNRLNYEWDYFYTINAGGLKDAIETLAGFTSAGGVIAAKNEGVYAYNWWNKDDYGFWNFAKDSGKNIGGYVSDIAAIIFGSEKARKYNQIRKTWENDCQIESGAPGADQIYDTAAEVVDGLKRVYKKNGWDTKELEKVLNNPKNNWVQTTFGGMPPVDSLLDRPGVEF
ncbi:RHS repeat-associated core domain-containing protein [Orenia marismortui]|uniref:RHS repeat-associated protein n=1 Tax=Orenia marismortui TaxID=46469 RepID=A0A4R8GXU3_9FIRM|nr:RHS repeat-associated core domain-containing protein [Orenia marismortui]TDX51140.1 RHS repeat-associated protein [Orenia marismortui]